MLSNRVLAIATVSVATVVLAAGSTHAAPIFYTDETNFTSSANSAGVNLSTNSLDNHPDSGDLSTTSSTFGGLTISANNATVSSNRQAELSSSPLFGSGKAVSFSALDATSGEEEITFAFASSINAFGINIFDAGDFSAGRTDITLSTPTGSDVVYQLSGTSNGNQLFAGVVDPGNSFTNVTLTTDIFGSGPSASDTDLIEIDSVQSGEITSTSIPAPASIGLLGAGLMGLGLIARQRRAA